MTEFAAQSAKNPTRAENAHVGLPSEEEAMAAYSAVWQSARGIDAHNVESVRREAMSAVFSLIRPAFEAKDAEIATAKERADMAVRQMAKQNDRILSAEAKLAKAVEDEREACARVAERCALNPRGRRYSDFGAAREDISEAIRSRGEK